MVELNPLAVKPKVPKGPRPHAALIHAWADGATIEWKNSPTSWTTLNGNPGWLAGETYRIKPSEDNPFA